MTQVTQPPVVLFDEFIKHFPTQAEAARVFGVSRAALQQWKAKGVIPPLRALQFASIADKVSLVNTNCNP